MHRHCHCDVDCVCAFGQLGMGTDDRQYCAGLSFASSVGSRSERFHGLGAPSYFLNMFGGFASVDFLGGCGAIRLCAAQARDGVHGDRAP